MKRNGFWINGAAALIALGAAFAATLAGCAAVSNPPGEEYVASQKESGFFFPFDDTRWAVTIGDWRYSKASVGDHKEEFKTKGVIRGTVFYYMDPDEYPSGKTGMQALWEIETSFLEYTEHRCSFEARFEDDKLVVTSLNTYKTELDPAMPLKVGTVLSLDSNPREKASLLEIRGDIRDAAKARECLAKGIAAEEKEQFGIALYWYYNAPYYDVTLSQARQRAADLEAKLKSGNPWGVTGNNSIQIKLETDKRWPVLRKQTEDFFKANNPFLEDGNPRVRSVMGLSKPSVNPQNGTATYEASYGPSLGWPSISGNFDDSSGKYVVANDAAFRAMQVMGVRVDSFSHVLVQAELVNGNGKVIAVTPTPPESFEVFSSPSYGNRYIRQYTWESGTYYIAKLTWNPGWQMYNYAQFWSDVTFTVPIADVTDEGMTARILKVYQYSDPDEKTDGVFRLLKTTVIN